MNKVLFAILFSLSTMASAEIVTNYQNNISSQRDNFARVLKNQPGTLSAVHCNDVLINGRDAFLQVASNYYNHDTLTSAEKGYLMAGARKRINRGVAKCIRWASRGSINNVIGRQRYRSQIWVIILDQVSEVKAKIQSLDNEMNVAESERKQYENDPSLLAMVDRYLLRKDGEIRGAREDFSLFVESLQRKLRTGEKFSPDLNEY